MSDAVYRTVLIATDGSSDAGRAADHGIALARACHAALVVVAVLDVGAFVDPHGHVFTPELMTREREALERALADIADRARAAGLSEIHTEVLNGPPDPTLLDAITRFQADVIVVGSHGRNVLGRLLLGSTSEHLVRHATCPVLVVRPRQEETTDEDTGQGTERDASTVAHH